MKQIVLLATFSHADCKPSMEQVSCTKPEVETKYADQYWCDEGTRNEIHIKKVPQCKEVTKQNCVTKWEMDEEVSVAT